MTRRLRGVAALAIAAVGSAAATAVAAPPQADPVGGAGPYHVNTATVDVRGSDGLRYHVTLRLADGEGPTASGGTVSVSLRCSGAHCPAPAQWTVPVSSSDVTYPAPTQSTTTLVTKLAGTPLVVHWNYTMSTRNVTAGFGGDADGVYGPVDSGGATVSVTMFGLTCTGTGAVRTYYGLYDPPSGVTSPPKHRPRAFTTQRHHRASCAPA